MTNRKCRLTDDFHQYILDGHTFFGCKPFLLLEEHKLLKCLPLKCLPLKCLPKGLMEDFVLYLFNHHEMLKCYASFDYFPLTYTAKRLMFIGRHTTLLLISIIFNGLLVLYSNIAINFYLAQPMQSLSELLFTYVLLEASVNKSFGKCE